MDVNHAVRELVALELVSVKRVGREDWVAGTITGRKLYETAKPYMITPVKKRVYARMQEKLREFPLAGESALAERTMLCEPMVECRAIFYRDFNKLMEKLCSEGRSEYKMSDEVLEVFHEMEEFIRNKAQLEIEKARLETLRFRQKVAKDKLDGGLSVEDVAKYTSLTMEKVQEIKDRLIA